MSELGRLLADLFNCAATLLDCYHAGDLKELQKRVMLMKSLLARIEKQLKGNCKLKIKPRLEYDGCPRCEG